VRVCPTGAIFEVIPRQRFAPEQIRHPEKVVRSVCPYCGVGCQVDLHVSDNKVIRVTSPDIELDTPNQGSTCVKGRFGYDFPQHRDRLTRPLVRKGWTKEGNRWVWKGAKGAERRAGPWRTIEGEGRRSKPGTPPRATGKSVRELPLLERLDLDIRDRVATPADWYSPFREATWEEALELTAQELLRIKAARGPDSLACFSSAKCSNEENYVLMRMFRGALGTNNVDHCTRLCHSTSVAAMQRAINTAAASGSMREIEQACDVIFIAGANTTESHPVFGAALKRAHEKRAKLIVADPRRTELAGRADVHLQMQPGTDVALYSGMLNHILSLGLENAQFISERTHDFDRVRAAVAPYTPEKAAKITGVPADKIRRAAEIYAEGPNTSTLWAMGLTQHANGTDIVTSLLNLMFACGMIGRWGAAMLPVRGQNNVQGASDMGAVPFAYTDYQPVTDTHARDLFAKTWGVPADALSLKGGLMLTEVVKPESGIRGMYIMGENPIISDPDIAHAEHWFQELEFLAVQDLFLTETARYADVVLPASSFAEKTGTFVNTERRIQLAHQACTPPGDARGDLEILIDLSNRLGLPTPYRSAEHVMREIAQVTPSWAGVTYERLEGAGLQYPVPTADHPGTAFLFDESFPTADGLVQFVAVEYTDPVELPDDDYPFVMNTGRQLFHWHTGTMTRRSSGLDAREPTAIVEIHPEDAKQLQVREGELVRLTSRRNSMVSAARISDRVARGQVFVPFHFREAAANLLTNPVLDPYAKMAELKVCAVRIERA
jgi:formate dehydrogenase alpha subunit